MLYKIQKWQVWLQIIEYDSLLPTQVLPSSITYFMAEIEINYSTLKNNECMELHDIIATIQLLRKTSDEAWLSVQLKTCCNSPSLVKRLTFN